MSKKKVDSDVVTDGNPNVPLVKAAILVPRSIINGHVLAVGTVVELTEEEIANHRSNGLPLDDVDAHDDREVYSVREPFVAKDNG